MNYEEAKNSEFLLNEKISNAVLIFLLLVRLADDYLPVWIFGANTPDWFSHWYACLAYVLTATLVWLNRHKLAALNIDRPFMTALIFGGVLYAFYLKYGAGIFVGITAGLILIAYQTNQLVFNNPVPYSKGTGLLIFLIVLLAIAPVFLFQPTLKTPLNFDLVSTTFIGVLMTELAGIVFEEVLFRGALWAFVRSFGLSEQVAFYTQAILFWISHHKFLLLDNPYSFWISLPIQAILLGLMTWRSKSLTPSTISHFLFNFMTQILLTIFK